MSFVAPPFVLLSYQQELLSSVSHHAVTVVEKSRRTGYSWAISFEAVTTAVRLIEGGARFLGTNPDPTGPSVEGSLPACGAVAAMIQRATGIEPYFIGKPNPLMMREGLNVLGAHSESTVMIGDRMDTDVLCGIEAGLETILVLSGVTAEEEVERFSYRPSRIVRSVADLIDEL